MDKFETKQKVFLLEWIFIGFSEGNDFSEVLGVFDSEEAALGYKQEFMKTELFKDCDEGTSNKIYMTEMALKGYAQ